MSETQKITALFFLLPSEFNDAKSYEMLLICQTKCVNLQALKYFAMEKEKYKLLKQQIEALVAGEDDSVSVMANVSAAIHQEMGFFWTGFYIVKVKNCIWAHSKEALPACIFLSVVVSVVLRGSVQKPLWFLMWSSSRVI